MTVQPKAAASAAVLSSLLLASVPACATAYFVAPQGDDSRTGTTAGEAFRTLQHAVDKAEPGDTVEVEDGTFGSDSWTVVDFGHGGTAKAPLDVHAAHPHNAIIGSGNKTKYGFAFEPRVSYVNLRGFDIQAVREAGIIIGSSNAHIRVIDNHLHTIGRECSDTSVGHSGIYVEGSYNVIGENRFDDIGRHNPGEQGCKLKTTNYQNHDHGIYAAGAVNLLISGNTFGPMRHGWAIQIYREHGTRPRHITIVDNTFQGANPHRDGTIELGAPGLDTGLIANNRFIWPRGAAISYSEGNLDNVVVKNNKIVGNLAICSRWPASRNKGISFINNTSTAK